MGVAQEIEEAVAPEAKTLAKPLVDKVAGVADKFTGGRASKILDLASNVKPTVNEVAGETLGNMRSIRHVYEQNPQGQKIGKMVDDYNQQLKAQHSIILQRKKEAGQVITPEVMESVHKEIAPEIKKTVLGKNMVNVSSILAELRMNPDTYQYSQILSDAFGVHMNMENPTHMHDANKRIKNLAQATNLPDTEAKRLKMNAVVKYQAPEKLEQALASYFHYAMLPTVAIKHATDLAKLPMKYDILPIIKGVASAIKERGASQEMLDSGIMLHKITRDLKQAWIYKHGALAQVTNPTVSAIAHSVMKLPGFNAIRDMNVIVGGHVATHAINDAAERLWVGHTTGNSALLRRGERELQRLGIDPHHVLANQGKVLPDEMRKGIYKAVDDTVFLDVKKHSSALGQSHWAFRNMTTFHGFVNAQSAFFRREGLYALKNAKGNSWQGVYHFAKYLTMLGAVLPAVGEMVKCTEQLVKGDKVTLKDDLDKLSGSEGIAMSAQEWVEMLSHMAAFGVWYSLAHSGAKFQLVGYLAGAPVEMSSRIGVDAIKAYQGLDKDDDGESSKWLKKDLLSATAPTAGAVLNERVWPKKQNQEEEEEEK